jgi:hypothetical protein
VLLLSLLLLLWSSNLLPSRSTDIIIIIIFITAASFSADAEDSFRRCKASRVWRWPPTSPSDKINNDLSYTFKPAIRLYGVDRETSHLTSSSVYPFKHRMRICLSHETVKHVYLLIFINL